MQERQLEKSVDNIGQELESLFEVSKKEAARLAAREEMKRLQATGQLYTLSDEEIAVLRAFRRFKLRMKRHGEVFKWQSTKGDTTLIEVMETGLIVHPQEA